MPRWVGYISLHFPVPQTSGGYITCPEYVVCRTRFGPADLTMSRKGIAMKSNQGSFMKRAVLVGLIAGSGILAASAYAVSADRVAGPSGCEAQQLHKGESGREGRRAAHLASLKEKLKLAAEQEAAWNTFIASAHPGPRQPIPDRQAKREEFEKLSTPERLDRMQAMMEMRRARMAERAVATKAFYAQLSPGQQQVFDAEAMPGRHHRGQHPFRDQS